MIYRCLVKKISSSNIWIMVPKNYFKYLKKSCKQFSLNFQNFKLQKWGGCSLETVTEPYSAQGICSVLRYEGRGFKIAKIRVT